MKSILKSYSRKIEFGDILKRVQETIRKDRAQEKKKKKFGEEVKQITQTQANGRMIAEIKVEMKKMMDVIEAQNEMIKELMSSQPVPKKTFYPDSELSD